MNGFITLLLGLIIFGCDQPNPRASAGSSVQTDSVRLNNLFIHSDAVRVLGEPAHMSDSTLSGDANHSIFHSSYMADEKDTASGKTGNIYFLAEQFGSVNAAHEKYAFIKTANEKNGINVLQGLGDEAYFHSDNENFYFIMVRKGRIVLNMKVNKITSKTPLKEFNQIAKEIINSRL